MAYKVTNGRTNKIYYAIFFGFLALFIFFLSSKNLLFDSDPIDQTKINESVSGLTDTNITLRNWVYDPGKNLMEVRLETDKPMDDSFNGYTLTFEAKIKNKVDQLPVQVRYHDDQMYVVWIKNIPEDFKGVGLIIQEKKSKSNPLLNEDGEDGQQDQTIESDKYVVLKCDYRTVKKGHLEKKSKHEYALEKIKMDIQEQEKEIQKLEKKISLQDDLKNQLLKDIDKIEEEQIYQTESEKQQSDGDIQSKRNAIMQVEAQKQDLINQLNEAREKAIILQKQLEDEQNKFVYFGQN